MIERLVTSLMIANRQLMTRRDLVGMNFSMHSKFMAFSFIKGALNIHRIMGRMTKIDVLEKWIDSTLHITEIMTLTIHCILSMGT